MNKQNLLETSVEQWNRWRRQHPQWRPNLSGINLSQCYLFEVDLSDLNLSHANLTRACLIGANLSRANLSRADLKGAYLDQANLKSANLSWSKLLGANLKAADLRGANLSGAQLVLADLADANLRQSGLLPKPPSLGNLPSLQLSLHRERYAISSPAGHASIDPLHHLHSHPLPSYYPEPMVELIEPSFSKRPSVAAAS